ncbi:MAG: protein translocase subunit SecF [Bdellovibrionales bacterium]|jgi:preprotein translocase subunit SecF|nr:protein translocase subunit SecF [Bdellovibrionales bacterium]
MAFRLRFIKDDTKINFMGHHKIGMFIGVLLIAATFFFLATRGLNYGIDFTGGVLIEVSVPQDVTVESVRQKLAGLEAGTPSIQEFGENTLMIKLPGKEADTEAQKKIYAEVAAALGPEAEFRRTEYVGPQVGGELIKTGIYAFGFSMIGIMLYVWMRYEWQFGLASVVSLAHDVIITLLFFILTGIEFDLATVAAILLVAGYSVNDTVIVFDRIREKLRKYRKMPLFDVINVALNETLGRTLITSLTTLAVMIVLAAFGGAAIQGFIYAMILGVAIGSLSSIYVAAPLLLYLNVRADKLGQSGDATEEPAAEKA